MVLGAVVCGTGSSVVIPMVQSLKMQPISGSTLTLESSLSDVICVVLVYALSSGVAFDPMHALALPFQMAFELGISIVVGVLGAIFWLLISKWIRLVPNTMFAEVAFVFVLFGIAQLLHGTGPITALVFGVCVTNLPADLLTRFVENGMLRLDSIRHEKLDAFAEVAFLTKVAFFAYLGISVTFSEPAVYVVAAIIIATIYVARLPIVWVVLPKQTTRKDAYYASLMIPKGLVAAVLAAKAAERLAKVAMDPNGTVVHGMDIPAINAVRDVAFAVVLLSIVVTSMGIPLIGIPGLARVLYLPFGKFTPETGDLGTSVTLTATVTTGAPSGEVREK
jgi:NhaP-type Na+/H+ or K+/H+ antiporter